MVKFFSKIEIAGFALAEHPTYGVIKTCDSNMGKSKRQFIVDKFHNINYGGKRWKKFEITF